MLERLQLSDTHAKHLEEVRKIPCEIAAEAGCVSRGPHLAFEFKRNGVCMYRQIKREWTDPETGARTKTFHIEPKDPPGGLFFWNDDCLNEPCNGEPLIITEGAEDAMSWLSIGAPFVVSVPNGTPNRPGEGDIDPREDHRFGYLWIEGKLDPRLEQFTKIIIAVDDDKAGRVLRDELAIRLGRDRCWYLTYPKDDIAALRRPAKDSNEVLVHFGEDALGELLEDALPIVPSRLSSFSQIPETKKVAFSTGWRGVDPFMQLVAPELVVLTGNPGHGKSQFALALGANLALHHQMRGAILQFEDDVERNRGDLIRYALHAMSAEPGDEAKIIEARTWVDRWFLTISPSENAEEDQDLAWLMKIIEEAATRHGCKWLVIDPWNEVEHMFAKGQTEAQYLNTAIRKLKRAARRFQIILIIAAHPSLEGGRKTDLETKSLYDISGGAVWRNKADHGVIVHRNTPTEPITHIKVEKSKNHLLMGRPGTFQMRYLPRAGTYEFVP